MELPSIKDGWLEKKIRDEIEPIDRMLAGILLEMLYCFELISEALPPWEMSVIQSRVYERRIAKQRR